MLDPGEVCDDRNLLSGDGCSGDCLSDETCGNDYLDAIRGEQCDTGPALAGDGCTASCVVEVAGWAPWSPARGYDRIEAGAAYDSARERVVVVGGSRAFDARALSTTLEYDGDGWRLRSDLAVTPPARVGPAVAYDANRRVVVAFGGRDGNTLLGDTWEYDGEAWTQVVGAGPSPRAEAAMAYDTTRGVIVLFGGNATTSLPPTPLDDTWEFDGAWTQVTPATSPPARRRHAMAYDPAHGRTLVHGGRTTTAAAPLGDLWSYDGVTWTAMATSGASVAARSGHAMAFDPVRDVVVLVGGQTSGGYVGDVKVLDGDVWSAATTGASARADHVLTSVADGVLLYGGLGTVLLVPGEPPPVDGGPAGQTWHRVSSTWSVVTPGLVPRPRTGGAMAYDTRRGRLVLFGGRPEGSVEPGATDPRGDTWERVADWWERRPSGGGPAPRTEHALAYDEARGVVVLFGGVGDGDVVLGDTWEYDGAGWTVGGAGGPSARVGAALAYDPSRGGLVLFGGDAGAGPLADTWAYVAGAWTAVATTAAPPVRSFAGLAYDRAGARLVLMGGVDAVGAHAADTWQLDGDAWHALSIPAATVAVDGHAQLAYHPIRQRVVRFAAGTLWELADEWRVVPTGVAPSDRTGVALAFDGPRRELLLLGGSPVEPDPAIEPAQEIWAFAFTSPFALPEACVDASADTDGDGLAGCADPDCWPWCTPTCPPSTSCPADAPTCGDGACAIGLEDAQRCPADCAAP
ncbi:MAG: hypothetical protein R2939_21420 [Kofleriaceae bacterium]